MAKSLLQKMKDLRKRGTAKGYAGQKTDRKKAIDKKVDDRLYGAKSKKGKKA